MIDKTIRFGILILFSVGMLSCNSTLKNNTYKINGNVSNVTSGEAILTKLDLVSNKKVIVDSTSIVNGKFTFTGSVETPYLHSLFINDNKKGIPFFLENSKIDIVFDTTNTQKVFITGSREDSLFRKYTIDQIFEKDAGMEIMTKYPEYVFAVFTAYYQFQINEIHKDSMEMILNNFKDNRFSILSISVDESRANWVKAIHDDKIGEWNHASNLKGWDTISKLYGVRAVPQNFLIDPNGIIIDKNTSSEKLNEILDKKLNSMGNKN